MRKLFFKLLFVLALIGLSFNPSIASEEPKAAAERNASNEAAQMIMRLHEIKKMDKSSLSKEEKKDIKKEVKEIKKELKAKKRRWEPWHYVAAGAILAAVVFILIAI